MAKKKDATKISPTGNSLIQVNKKMEESLETIIAEYKEKYQHEVSEPHRVCSCCKKTKSLTNYFKARNPFMHNTRIGVCKGCLEENVNFGDFNEVQYFLTLINVPFVEDVWQNALHDPNPISKYIQMMNLGQYAHLDSASINRIKSYSKAFDTDPYQAQLDMMTDDERGYLQAKWGYHYDILDCVKMEEYYNDMMEDYEITTRSHQDYLKKIVQTSLILEQLIENSQYDDFKKVSKTYDDLMKSADFVQNKKDNKKDAGHNAFGVIFEMAEKKGFIPQYHNDEEPDIVDRTIKNVKAWTETLVKGEADLDVLMENAAKRVIEQEKKEKETIQQEYSGIGGLNDEGR